MLRKKTVTHIESETTLSQVLHIQKIKRHFEKLWIWTSNKYDHGFHNNELEEKRHSWNKEVYKIKLLKCFLKVTKRLGHIAVWYLDW